MSVNELKTKIHSLIDEVENEQLLAYIDSLLVQNGNANEIDWWDELTDEQKKETEEANEESKDERNLIDHEEVKKIARKWLGK
ncbi:MAG: hypothetical protein ABI723_10120 [Bacteroidia bacterium]